MLPFTLKLLQKIIIIHLSFSSIPVYSLNMKIKICFTHYIKICLWKLQMISLVLSIIVISSYSASFNSQQCLPVSHILLFEMFFLHILLYHTLLIFQLSNRPLLLNLFYFTSKCWSIKGLNLNSYSLFAILSLTSFLFSPSVPWFLNSLSMW